MENLSLQSNQFGQVWDALPELIFPVQSLYQHYPAPVPIMMTTTTTATAATAATAATTATTVTTETAATTITKPKLQEKRKPELDAVQHNSSSSSLSHHHPHYTANITSSQKNPVDHNNNNNSNRNSGNWKVVNGAWTLARPRPPHFVS